MLFGKMIDVYSENDMKPINALCGQNWEFSSVTADGKYAKHYVLKGVLEFTDLAFSALKPQCGRRYGPSPGSFTMFLERFIEYESH
jgi:hypothetical protein